VKGKEKDWDYQKGKKNSGNLTSVTLSEGGHKKARGGGENSLHTGEGGSNTEHFNETLCQRKKKI